MTATGGRRPEALVYTDGACLGNPGPGGWAAVVVGPGRKRVLSGREPSTTNNRMELMAAIKGLEAVPKGGRVRLVSDSQYLVNTMTRGWKRRANLDLWRRLDALVQEREVSWEWTQGHAGDPLNEEANALAQQEARRAAQETAPQEGPSPAGRANALTHVGPSGEATMVDVGWKPPTRREAVARATVTMRRETLALIKENRLQKGDVLAAARLAGIMAAKRTWELIPLCHPLPLDQVTVDLTLDEEAPAVHVEARARTTAKTGVEMEALTAAAVAALTVYDMCKAVDRGMRVEGLRLVMKTGGLSGDVRLEE